MKPNIAIITGGDSSEKVISMKSGENIFNSVDQERFTPWMVFMEGKNWKVFKEGKGVSEIDKSDFSFILNGKKIIFDFAYIIIHGTPGEDGILQGYFDLLKIPYSSCGVDSSALTFNKWFCLRYLKGFGIHVADSVFLTKGEIIDQNAIINRLKLPVFVKPNAGGSSFGVTKVKSEEELIPAVLNAWEESRQVIIEEFLDGEEFTCGLVKLKQKEYIFPVTEVIPNNEFFDFDAKYTPGATEEITPARLAEGLFNECQQLSSYIYDLCNCKGIVRVDYILKEGKFYFLELNTIPGMTDTSFIPQQIKAMGLNLKDVITEIIKEGLNPNY